MVEIMILICAILIAIALTVMECQIRHLEKTVQAICNLIVDSQNEEDN